MRALAPEVRLFQIICVLKCFEAAQKEMILLYVHKKQYLSGRVVIKAFTARVKPCPSVGLRFSL
jgi:hypothetical protein